MSGMQNSQTMPRPRVSSSRYLSNLSRFFAIKVGELIGVAIILLEMTLLFRLVLRLIAANPNNVFASLVYRISGLLLKPFADLTVSSFASRVLPEINTLIAMVVYALLGWALVRLVRLLLTPV